MTSIMGQIELEHPELFALEFEKNCWIWLCLHSSIYKYRPLSTKLDQNVCDHKISNEFDYGSNQTRTVQVICLWIRKFAIFDFVYTSICKYRPISTKLGHNISALKISDEFDYGTNQTRTSRVMCPWIWKNCWIRLCLHSEHLQILTNHAVFDLFPFECHFYSI